MPDDSGLPTETRSRRVGLSRADRIAKRVFDLFFAVPGIILLVPVFVVVALWVKHDSRGPVFFRQERVGQDGRPFRIWKFRTMVAEQGNSTALISKTGDARVTRCGRYLRRHKLDELPQLLNVMAGEMSLVGPRPEVAKFVAAYPDGLRSVVLSVPPGITDYAALEFRNEGDLLAGAVDPEGVYVREILPTKLALYRKYVENWSMLGDLKLVLRTIAALV